MKLPVNERKLFFDNFLGLLAYVNDKHKLVKDFGHPQSPLGLNSKAIRKLKNKLWKDVTIIDEYIESIWDMPAEHIQLLRSWKHNIAGKFFILRHLKKYTVFFDDERDVLYGVSGITNDIEEIFPKMLLPVIVDAVLLPFKDRIIYDSLLPVYNISFGRGIRSDLNERYMEIKTGKGIISTMV